MLLFFKAPVIRENTNFSTLGLSLEVVSQLERIRELELMNSFVVWQLFKRYLFGKTYCIYAIIHGNKCVHYSHVIGKGWRFPFMKDNDIEIGPCWTQPEFRSRGLFSSVLRNILSDFQEHQIWIFAEETNVASIRGIERAGFKFVGKGLRTKPFGCHLIGRFVISKGS